MNTKEEELKSKVYDLFTEVKLFYKQEGRTQMLEKVERLKREIDIDNIFLKIDEIFGGEGK